MTSRSKGGEGLCDNCTVAPVIKSVTMEEESQKCLKLRDVIYGRPLITISVVKTEYGQLMNI
jgi:hypothetical protein